MIWILCVCVELGSLPYIETAMNCKWYAFIRISCALFAHILLRVIGLGMWIWFRQDCEQQGLGKEKRNNKKLTVSSGMRRTHFSAAVSTEPQWIVDTSTQTLSLSLSHRPPNLPTCARARQPCVECVRFGFKCDRSLLMLNMYFRTKLIIKLSTATIN